MKSVPPVAANLNMAECQRQFQVQRDAERATAAPDLRSRIERLDRLATGLLSREAMLADAISADFSGRAYHEFMLAELAPLLASIAFARKNLAAWMRPHHRRVAAMFQPGRSWVEYQPLGCVGIISPWNYPLLLSISPMIDALAAGNRVLLKPSEITPRFSARLAEMISDIFDPTEVSVVQGGSDVARIFCALPFDHLLFTGSATRARELLRIAAEQLTPTTLELGGKCPAIIFPDFDIERAAHDVAIGKFFNAGQTCVAPDYALLPDHKAVAFAKALLSKAETFYPALDDNPDYTSLISDAHLHRLEHAVTEAGQGGARILRHSAATIGRRMAPVVVLDPPHDCALMREEIFGPVLPVLRYSNLTDAIDYINANSRPLALYPFTYNHRDFRRILDATMSGGVTWNGTILHCAQPDLPFGGVGESGFGAYHGEDGFRRFSHARSIYRAGRFSGFTWLAPPHGKAMNWLLNRIK